MYFSDGFTLSGSYTNQEESGEESNSLGLGFSYLALQKESNSLDRPTLIQGGTFEVSGFYNSIDTDGLNMEMLSMGLGYYLNNIKIGFYYETLYDFSGDDLDELNDLGYNVEMTGSSQIFSIGLHKELKSFIGFYDNIILFLDLMILDSEVTTSMTLNGNELLNLEVDGSANLLRLGGGFKINNNLVLQPMVTMNEDREKRYSITAIFGL